MAKKPIMAGAVLIAVLLLGSVLFIISRPSAPAITVRHVRSVQSGESLTATFEITNRTSNFYIVIATGVEVRNGSSWKRCFEFSSFPDSTVGPHGHVSSTLQMTNLPTDLPLRLQMCAAKQLYGPEGFLMRCKLRFLQGFTRISLNPFDKTMTVGGRTKPFVSDEFVEPESK